MKDNSFRTGYPNIDKPWLQYYSQEAIQAPLPTCSAYELLYNNNKDHLSDIAINYYDRKITYGMLFEKIEETAKAFYAIGVREKEIVMICSVNTPETVYAIYALNRLGAIANMVDPRTNQDGIHNYITETKTRFILTVDLAYPLLVKAAQGTDVETIISVSPGDSLPQPKKFFYRLKNKRKQLEGRDYSWKQFLENGKLAKPRFVPYQKDTCAIIAHTGGTTGIPKGVMVSNDNLNAVVHGYQHTGIPFARQQRYFNDLPPFIIYGLCLATHTVLCYGLEMILYPVFDSKGFPKMFSKYRPHHFSALPDHLKYLAEDKLTQKMDLSFLITAAVGGDSVDIELEKNVNCFLHDHGCQFDVIKGYGMTETAATAVTAFQGANAIGSVGVPQVMNNVKILDLDTGKELPYNQTGEIYISSPSIMIGYYEKPEETAEMIVTDDKGIRWIRTGDLGHMNENGLLFHEGRIRRIYLTAFDGQPAKIFPMLVENCIREVDGVKTCAVVGRLPKNSAYYEAVAFVVKEDFTAIDDIIEHKIQEACIENVPSYMCPVEYRFVPEIPHTPIGKVDFRALEKECAHQG